MRRAELRRQKWNIRRRELELIASKNFLMPRFDAVGRYRWRGFGDDLTGNESGGLGQFNSAYGNLATGNFQEWQLGLEFSVPIGFRQAHAGVRNAELVLARERALVARSAARSDPRALRRDRRNGPHVCRRADQLQPADRQPAAASKRSSVPFEENKEVSLDLLLDAQRRLMESEVRYYRGAGRVCDRHEKRPLREGHAARLRRRVSGRRAVAGRSVSRTRPTWNRCVANRGSSTTRRRGRRWSAGARCRRMWRVRPARSIDEFPVEQQDSRPSVYPEEPASALVPAKVDDKTGAQRVDAGRMDW